MSTLLRRPSPTDEPGNGPPQRSSLLVRASIGLAAVLGLLILAPETVKATVTRPAALARVIALGLAWLAYSWGVRRYVGHRGARTLALVIPGVALLWWSLAPSFTDTRVEQALPGAASQDSVQDSVAATQPAAEAPVAPAPTAPPAPQTPVADAPAPAAPPAPAEAPAPPVPAPPSPTAPVKLSSGAIQGLAGHRGAGEAAVYALPDDSRIVRLEDYDVSNGPGLELWVVPGARQSNPGSGVKLADLPGNQGSFNATIPAGTDLSQDFTVLIWCAPFTVEVAGATLPGS